MMNAKAVGKRLQALRRSAGLTQENVAEALGISDNYVSNIETGRDICSMWFYWGWRICIMPVWTIFWGRALRITWIKKRMVSAVPRCCMRSAVWMRCRVGICLNISA